MCIDCNVPKEVQNIERVWDRDFSKNEKFAWNAFMALIALIGGFLIPKVAVKKFAYDDQVNYIVKTILAYHTLGFIQVQRNRSIKHPYFKTLLATMKISYSYVGGLCFSLSLLLMVPTTIFPGIVIIERMMLTKFSTQFILLLKIFLLWLVVFLLVARAFLDKRNRERRYLSRISSLFDGEDLVVVTSKNNLRITEFFYLGFGYLFGYLLIVFVGLAWNLIVFLNATYFKI